MKVCISFLIVMLCGLSALAQNNNFRQVEFEVKHYDYFKYLDLEPREKKWSFYLSIREIDENYYEACFSKELGECLYLLDKFRKNKIKLNYDGLCFNYVLTKDNAVKVLEKEDAIQYFKDLRVFISKGIKNDIRNELVEDVKYFIKYDDALDEELTREIRLIHEYDYCDIPIGEMGIIDNDQTVRCLI